MNQYPENLSPDLRPSLVRNEIARFAEIEEVIIKKLRFVDFSRFHLDPLYKDVLAVTADHLSLTPTYRSNSAQLNYYLRPIEEVIRDNPNRYLHGLQIAQDFGVNTDKVLMIQAFTEIDPDLEHAYKKAFTEHPTWFVPLSFYYFDKMGNTLKLITLPRSVNDPRQDLDIYPGGRRQSKVVSSPMTAGDFELVGFKLHELQKQVLDS